jgi:hypothetical protein
VYVRSAGSDPRMQVFSVLSHVGLLNVISTWHEQEVTAAHKCDGLLGGHIITLIFIINLLLQRNI